MDKTAYEDDKDEMEEYVDAERDDSNVEVIIKCICWQ